MFMIANATLVTPHRAAGAGGQSPSWRIWGQMFGQSMNPDGDCGWIYYGDDFEGYNSLTSTGAFGKGPYYGFTENSGSVANLTTDLNGVIQVASGATADNDTSFGIGQVAGLVKLAVGSPGVVTAKGTKVLFESRVRLPSVTNGAGSAFVGLAEPGLIADNGFITDAHALAQNDLLGFWVVDSDNDRVNFGYNVTSGTAQVVGYTAVTAATFVNLGFVYDPDQPSSTRLRWYVDGVEQSTYATGATIGESSSAAGSSKFPAGLHLSPAIDAKTDDSAAFTIDMDWWHLAMQRLG